jgi:cytochrome c peroxidase
MHGKGNFFDPRLDDAAKFPVAARAGFGHVKNADDQITPKLAGLHAYQLSLAAPKAPAGSFDAAAAKRGKAVFQGSARCAECHIAPLYTEPGWNLHTGKEIGIDDFQASRSPDGRYRTTPLRGLGAARSKGGYYHDGRFATLQDVVQHYDQALALGLAPQQKADLVQFLKSL